MSGLPPLCIVDGSGLNLGRDSPSAHATQWRKVGRLPYSLADGRLAEALFIRSPRSLRASGCKSIMPFPPLSGAFIRPGGSVCRVEQCHGSIRRFVFGTLVGATMVAGASAQEVTEATSGVRLALDVNWATDTVRPHTVAARVTPATAVSIHVTNVNLIGYELAVDITETTAPAYGAVSSLWDSLFELGTLLGGLTTSELTSGETFGAAHARWVRLMEQTDAYLSGFLPETHGSALTDPELQTLRTFLDGREARQARLVELRGAALSLATTAADSSRQAATDATMASLVGAIDTFEPLARASLRGRETLVGARAAGTLVQVVIRPIPRAGANGLEDGKSASISYFVEPSHPLGLTVGFAGSSISRTVLERVRAVTGDDLFAEGTAEQNTLGLAAWLGYRFWQAPKSAKLALSASMELGADIQADEQGARTLYLGLGLLLDQRWAIGAGAAIGVIESGEDPSSPGFFRRIARERVFAPYLKVGVAVSPL